LIIQVGADAIAHQRCRQPQLARLRSLLGLLPAMLFQPGKIIRDLACQRTCGGVVHGMCNRPFYHGSRNARLCEPRLIGILPNAVQDRNADWMGGWGGRSGRNDSSGTVVGCPRINSFIASPVIGAS
jgi:hypothetical protein